MNGWHAVLFGVVEGVSEFLPISSTGHLILTGRLIGFPQNNFLKSLEIAIQLGAIGSVAALYWRSFLVDREVLKRVLVAFLPTAVLGFIFYRIIKRFLLGNTQVVLWSLFLGGIFLILFERFRRPPAVEIKEIARLPYRTAFWIGVAQALAMIPGVSRSAATVVGGLALGVERSAVVEFSFLLAVPTMAAATGLDLVKNAGLFSMAELGILVTGFVTSFAVAIGCIRWLLSFVKRHDFVSFGIYRMILALLFWFVLKI